MHADRSPQNVIPFPTRKRSFLCDGPLMTAPERRSAMVFQMSAALIEANAFRDETDAKRHLHWCGYSAFDVALLYLNAMQMAFQCVEAAARMCVEQG